VDRVLYVEMRYEKTFTNFIDIVKGLSIGYFVASLVSFVLQHNKNGLFLSVFGIIFLIVTIFLSLIFDYFKNKEEI